MSHRVREKECNRLHSWFFKNIFLNRVFMSIKLPDDLTGRNASTVLRPYMTVGIGFGIVARGKGVRSVHLVGAVLMRIVFEGFVRKDHDENQQHDDDHADIPPVVIVTAGVYPSGVQWC